MILSLLGLSLAGALPVPADVVPHRDEPPSSLLHAEVRPLGFSEDGKLGVLYIAPDEAVGCYQWSVSVLSLVTDKTVETLTWSEGSCAEIVDVASLWQHELGNIEALLVKHGVQAQADLRLRPLPVVRGADLLDARLVTGPLNPTGEPGVTSVPVTLLLRSSEQGEKSIAALAVTSRDELPFSWGHEVLGYIPSPYEERVVVLVRELHRGWEGLPAVEQVHLVGASLDSGFKPGAGPQR